MPKEHMRLRFRRTTTIPDKEGGKVYQANSVASVEATEEAWDVVNRGEADLDPAPGIDGQPFPPDTLTKAEVSPATPMLHGAPPTGTAAAAASKDYDAMTAEDLHHEATRRNLEGRSGLDKAGLIKALQKDDKKTK